jgi:hypothetical protein
MTAGIESRCGTRSALDQRFGIGGINRWLSFLGNLRSFKQIAILSASSFKAQNLV